MAIKKFAYLFLLFFSNLTFSQCFEIQSILVDACDSGSATSDEGYNEMVRFQIGATALNTSNLTVNWPSNTWQGLIQNATTAAKVAQLNSDIIAAGGCGTLLEPIGGVLPANATVILVTSQNFNTSSNSFGTLTTNTYIIFQNNTSALSGHFGNYNATPGTRTLTINFGGSCSDAVTYQRSNLVNIFGTTGGTSADNNGSTVNFTASGLASYTNNGCIAPIQPFTVDAGVTSLTACAGQTINLIGTAQGQTSIAWTAPTGSFATPNALSTTYTIPSNTVTGATISLTLTNTNSCNNSITDQISITIVNSITPIFTQVAPICSGSALSALPTTSTNGIIGTWSPVLNNTTTTTYTFTPNVGQCASTATMTITVDTPAILHITKDDPNCNPNQLSWSTINTVSSTVATTTLGTNNITITKPTGGLFLTSDVFSGNLFPPQYNLPINSTTLANDAAGLFTFCYDNPVVNPQIAIASIGNGSTPVAINTSVPYQVIWAGPGMTFTNNQSLQGIEGYCIIVFPGTHQCISFDYLTAESYCNIVFGSQDSNCQIDPICQGESVTLAAHGSTNITWSPTTGLTYLPNNKVIATPTSTTTYTITSNNACQNQASITVTVNPQILPTFNPVASVCVGSSLTALPTTSINGITGSWSPALDNTTTTTYTFTPAAGQCASSASLTITINPLTLPTFNPVASICAGSALTALPTTSINGITGSWSPALDNTTTTTYTFTPAAGQCASSASLTITVNPLITPGFTQVAPICSGSTLSALPTTSNNGITGTWSPALINTATTLYTFTPDSGQCATTATMTITVNQIITPSFTQVPAICSGIALAALQITSNNGITGSWSPALDNTTTTTYTFTPDAGQCASTASMTINVTPRTIPTFNPVTSICAGSALTALPTTSINGITGSWSPALDNTTTTTYTFTPDAGQCASSTSLTITVNPLITPGFTQVAPICFGSTLSALPTTSNNGITGTWSPALNNTTTTLYTFTPDSGQCATTATMSITVNQIITPSFTQVPAICSGVALAALPITSNNGITGTWSPALNNTANTLYTFTPDTGQCATTATMTITVIPNSVPNFTQLQTICAGNPLAALPTTSINGITGSWSPALDNTTTTTYTFTPAAGQCATTASMTINVTPRTIPTFNQVASICIGSTLSSLPTTSNNGITGSWTPALNNTTTTLYTFTPDTGLCATTATMTIVVHPLPIVTPSVTTQNFCSGGTTNINLTSNVPGTTFSWTATATTITGHSGSVTGSGATSINQTLVLNPNILTPGQVTYVIVAEANGCVGAPVTVTVTVNPIPNVIATPTTQTICSGQATSISFSGAINNTVFTWNVLSSVGVSGALNGTGNAINHILTTTGLSQGTVLYEITPSINGCTGAPQTVSVTVNPVPVAFGSATHQDLCSGESTFINVLTFNPSTTFNWVVETFGVSGASAGSASGSSILIEQALSTTGNTQGYVDYIITPVLTACAGTPITVRVYVNPLPVVSLTDGTICVDAAGVPFQTYLLDSGLDNANYNFVWTFEGNTIPNATQATYSAAEVGTYTVVATNSTTNCVSNIASAVVTATNPATSLTVAQSDYFSDNATLIVTVAGGNGTLLYQLDAGILQESNVFTGVSGGSHTITVVDTQGCTYLTQEVLIIDYPRYFTPNGDGHNDTWNILGLNQPDAKLFIFDRYGKLIKQIVPSSSSSGWDGTYNNAPMPSTDYWFTLDYTENGAAKQFKAHFSLKR